MLGLVGLNHQIIAGLNREEQSPCAFLCALCDSFAHFAVKSLLSAEFAMKSREGRREKPNPREEGLNDSILR
jgi:hypothetical protein